MGPRPSWRSRKAFFFPSRSRHTRLDGDWSSDVCSSDLAPRPIHSSAETPAEIEETFDAIAYQKGAAVLRMIETYVGAQAFRTGVNAYLARHAYSSRSEEGRVGEEGRSRWSPYPLKKKKERAERRLIVRNNRHRLHCLSQLQCGINEL